MLQVDNESLNAKFRKADERAKALLVDNATLNEQIKMFSFSVDESRMNQDVQDKDERIRELEFEVQNQRMQA